MHPNFDPAMEQEAVEAEAERLGDNSLKPAFRRHARPWLKEDYERSIQRSGIRRAKGMQVHAEYTLYAHFFFLKRLLADAEKVRLFLDQDSGIRAAALAAFMEDIKSRRADAFYIRIGKDMTVDEKRRVVTQAKQRFKEAAAAFPGLSRHEVELELIKEQMQHMEELGHLWKDKWLIHPLPDMSEPEKAICYMTDLSDYSEDHLARLYGKATLHGIDRFFMQVRRRMSILERPISTSSRGGRTWHGYSAYNPEIISKLLDIFRVYYNYVGASEASKTPAMKLGLARGKTRIEDIIYK